MLGHHQPLRLRTILVSLLARPIPFVLAAISRPALSESLSKTRRSTVLACGFSCIEQWALSGSLSKAHRLALVCGDSGQGSSLRPAQLAHSQCLTAEHHSSLACARTRSSHPPGSSQCLLAKVSLGHALRAGPLSPLLNRDLRAELRF